MDGQRPRRKYGPLDRGNSRRRTLPGATQGVSFQPPLTRSLRERLASARITSTGRGSWDRGVPSDWVVKLVQDRRAFDFDAMQDRLDELSHQQVEVDGQEVHVVHAPGRGPASVPLLLTHGWPGSFLEHRPASGRWACTWSRWSLTAGAPPASGNQLWVLRQALCRERSQTTVIDGDERGSRTSTGASSGRSDA